jgi:hypothetical protein
MSKRAMPDRGTQGALREWVDAGESISPGEGMSNASGKPQGLNTEAEIQAHLAELEKAPAEDEFLPPVDYVPTERRTFQDVRDDVDQLRHEIDNLRARLSIIQQQAATVVRSNVEWADASAHAQLGPYPWAKLAGAMVATFVGARMLGRAAGFAAMVLPLIARPHRRNQD